MRRGLVEVPAHPGVPPRSGEASSPDLSSKAQGAGENQGKAEEVMMEASSLIAFRENLS